MIIKKVKLENYRSHSNTEVEFSKGINLILGKNGRGKTSILEAISLTMLNTKDRTGNKNSGKNYIKFGEKKALVDIDFIANDGREYNLKTSFTKTTKKQFLIDETGFEYDQNIKDKLEELCGIKKGFEDTYENIVVAKQNEFINIFKAKDKEREEIFNKIFNTQIYRDMYEGYLKDAVKKYEEDKKILERDVENLKDNIDDKEEISNTLNIEIENRKKFKEEFDEVLIENKKIEEEIKNYNNTDNEIKSLNLKLKNTKDNIKNSENILKENLSLEEKAKKSKDLVEENEKYYLEYLKLEKELKEKRTVREDLEKKEKLNIEYKNDIEKLEINIENQNKNIEKIKENISKNENEKEKLKKEILSLETDEKRLKKEADEILELGKFLRKIEEKSQSIGKEIVEKKANITNLKKNIKEKNPLFESISREQFDKNLSNIAKVEEKLKNIQNIDLNFEINLLKEVREEFSGKISPLLLNLEKLVLEDKKKLEEEEKELQRLEEEKKSYDDSLSKKLLENNVESIDELRDIWADKNAKLKNLNLDEKRNKIKNIEREIEKENTDLDLLKNKIQENLKDIEEFNSKIILDVDKNIEKIKIEILNLEKNQIIFKNSYDIYLKNETQANSLNSIQAKLEKSRQEIKKLEESEKILIEEIQNSEKSLSEISIDDCKEKNTLLKNKENELSKSLGSVEEKIVNLNKSLEKISEQEIKLKDANKKLKKLENKLKKANLIRNEIGEMGRYISKYMLTNISNYASVSFNKITGRSERIEWHNDEKDKYAVYLVGQDRKIPFEQLSGGEQVSVAIAIRGTMTQYFTNSKFMILDEPTNNLDTERKKLLAEYVGEILNNLDQSIIVTHDDTFREMAERIVEL